LCIILLNSIQLETGDTEKSEIGNDKELFVNSSIKYKEKDMGNYKEVGIELCSNSIGEEANQQEQEEGYQKPY